MYINIQLWDTKRYNCEIQKTTWFAQPGTLFDLEFELITNYSLLTYDTIDNTVFYGSNFENFGNAC